MELRELIRQIDALKREVDELRPLDPQIEGRIMQKFRLDWNYHSSNIEGNSLTYGETKTFLLHGLTADGKPLRDHLEIKGHNEAVQELHDIVREERPLTEQMIRGLHQIILGTELYRIPAQTPDGFPTSREVHPGRYKIEPNHVRTVTGETFYFASPEETPARMLELMDWYRGTDKVKETPLLVAAMFHYRFVHIHPFDDGNGRMARILMNLILMRAGYPPVIIPTQEKDEYFRALRQADGGEEERFVEYVGEQLLRSLSIYLRGARGEEIEGMDDLDKRIELLKAGLEEVDENDLKRTVRKSEEAIQSVIDRSIGPLVDQLDRKFRQFDDLFVKRVLRRNRKEYDLEDLLRAIHSSPRDLIDLYWEWNEFKRQAPVVFDVIWYLRIAFQKYSYDVICVHKAKRVRTLSKSYGDFLTTEEVDRIVRDAVDDVLQQIEKNLGVEKS